MPKSHCPSNDRFADGYSPLETQADGALVRVAQFRHEVRGGRESYDFRAALELQPGSAAASSVIEPHPAAWGRAQVIVCEH